MKIKEAKDELFALLNKKYPRLLDGCSLCTDDKGQYINVMFCKEPTEKQKKK